MPDTSHRKNYEIMLRTFWICWVCSVEVRKRKAPTFCVTTKSIISRSVGEEWICNTFSVDGIVHKLFGVGKGNCSVNLALTNENWMSGYSFLPILTVFF